MRNLHQLMQGFLDKRWDVAGCFLAVAGVVWPFGGNGGDGPGLLAGPSPFPGPPRKQKHRQESHHPVLFAASSEMQHTGCMNVFTTDHPLTSDASPLFLRLQRRVVKGFLLFLRAILSTCFCSARSGLSMVTAFWISPRNLFVGFVTCRALRSG